MSTASLALGVSVGGAFALLIILVVAAYCIYAHKHPAKRHGQTSTVTPDSLAGIKENTQQLNSKRGGSSVCFCCVQSHTDSVPPPDPPIKIELKDMQTNEVTVCWKPPEAYAASRIDSYVIYLRPSDKPRDWKRVGKSKTDITQYQIQLLEPDKRFVLGVASRNKGGESPIIESKPFLLRKQTEPVVPGKPLSVVVTDIQTDRMTLQWEPPKLDGNARIEYYHIAINDGRNNWIHLSKEDAYLGCNTFQVENLNKNTSYRFRIFAENSVGIGPCAEIKNAVFVKKEPGAPSKPLGPIRYNKTTHNSVTLSWKQRTHDIESFPVSRYIIDLFDSRSEEWREVGGTAENVTTFCVPKLPEDTEFKFRVRAVNDAGKSTPLIGKKVRTTVREPSAYGSTRSSKSAYSGSTNSNTKLTKAAIQRVLAHWESSGQQVPPRATNNAPTITSENKTVRTEMNGSIRHVSRDKKTKTSGLRLEPRLGLTDGENTG